MRERRADQDTPGVALVTGGSGAIGGEIARLLSKRGYFVVVQAYSDPAAAEQVRAELAGPGLVVTADVSDPDAVAEMVASARAHGPVDVVVNAAATMKLGLFTTQPIDDWRRMVEVNLVGPYLVCRATVPAMLRRGRGRVINLVSPAAVRATRGQSAYSASKAGLIGLTRSLAAECARRGVTVNAISPGFVESKMTADVLPEVRTMMLERVVDRREATPSDVASAVDFVLGCGYVTGQVIAVDGGLAL